MSKPKQYFRPSTLEEALELAIKPGYIAIARGAPFLGEVLLPYDAVVDLQDIAALSIKIHDEENIYLGGNLSLQSVITWEHTPELLKASITRSIPLNLRNGTSVGESLTGRYIMTEWIAMLTAMGAMIEHAGSLGDETQLNFWEQSVPEFVNYLHAHGHHYQGVVKGVRIPAPTSSSHFGAAHIARTPGDVAIINAAVRVQIEGNLVAHATAALCGASQEVVLPLELSPLIGAPLTKEAIAAASNFAEENSQPISDYKGSATYRRAMAGVLVRRALNMCVEKINQT